MFTVRQYEIFISGLRRGKTITEASIAAKVDPASMKSAILKSPEVREFVDSVTVEDQRA